MENENNKANETTAEESTKSEKLFTQEEVNGIVQSRLAQMKKNMANISSAEIEQRAKELDAREMKLTLKERLQEREMDIGLADVISCSSVDEIDEKLDKLQSIYKTKEDNAHRGTKKDNAHSDTGGFQIGGFQIGEVGDCDPIRTAMGLH